MQRRVIHCVVLACILTLSAVAVTRPPATAQTAFQVIGTFPSPAGDAEIVSPTPDGRYLLVTAGPQRNVAIVDIDNPAAPVQRCVVSTAAIGEPTSVAAHTSGAYGVAVIKNDPNPGTMLAFTVPTCAVLWQLPIGIGPDSVVITPDGSRAVVTIEDEESEVGDPSACPVTNVRPGRVDIVLLPQLSPRGAGVPTLQSVSLDLTGISGVNCPNDPQPEYVAVSPDSRLAYVTLQENNALATIDLYGATTLSIIALGVTDHLADTTNDGVANVTGPFTGRREPDGVAVSPDGQWIFTADEGDTSRTGTVFSGGRTMTVLRAPSLLAQRGGSPVVAPVIVTDTGAQIELLAAANNALPQSRARNRGPEPEGVTVFPAGASTIAAVTLERSNGVAYFDVTNPTAPQAFGFVPTGVGPEGIAFIPSRGLLVTANEVEGSLTLICVRIGRAACR